MDGNTSYWVINFDVVQKSSSWNIKETAETMDGNASYWVINFDVVQKSPSWKLKKNRKIQKKMDGGKYFGYFLILR